MKFIITIFILFASFLPAQEQTLTISTGFNKLEAKHLKNIISESFKRAKLKLNFQTLPNQRSLISANNGVTDGEAARISKISKIYKNLIRVDIPFYNIDIVILSKKNIHINKKSDLKKYTLGVVRGVKITEKIATNFSDKGIVKATNYKNLLRMLVQNRVDIIIVNKLGVYTSLRNFKDTTFYMKKEPLVSPKLYMHLNKKNALLIPRFEKAFKSMKKDGTIKRMNTTFNKDIKDKLLHSVKVILYD